MNFFTENRQKIIISFLLLFFTFFLPLNIIAQGTESKIDYSIKSNILNPDTLLKDSNEYRIFWHFVKWTYKEADEIKPLKLKSEFEEVGIKTEDEDFFDAYSFFKNVIVFHKRSVENWESFKDLAPNYKKKPK